MPKKITPIKHPKCLYTWGMAHFIDPRERKFHGTWINEGGREGERKGGRDTTKYYQYGSFSHWVMKPNQPFQPSQISTVLGFFKCLENSEYAHVPSYQSRI